MSTFFPIARKPIEPIEKDYIWGMKYDGNKEDTILQLMRCIDLKVTDGTQRDEMIVKILEDRVPIGFYILHVDEKFKVVDKEIYNESYCRTKW